MKKVLFLLLALSGAVSLSGCIGPFWGPGGGGGPSQGPGGGGPGGR